MINTAGNIRDEMITPNEELNLIFLKWTDETRKVESVVMDLHIKICYSSLLDEHWVIDDKTPVEVSGVCPQAIQREFGM